MYGWTEDPTDDTAHRPWPLPREPWIMAQRWSDLLFAHWPVPLDVIRPLVPSSLPIDLRDGSAWISIASFYLSHLRPRFIPPLPLASAFPELNVRTYTSLGGKPGVYFFSLDAGSAIIISGRCRRCRRTSRRTRWLPPLELPSRRHRAFPSPRASTSWCGGPDWCVDLPPFCLGVYAFGCNDERGAVVLVLWHRASRRDTFPRQQP